MTRSARPPKTLRKQRFYPHPVDAVWAALTTPEALAQWLMPNNFVPRAGAEFQFRVDPMGPIGGTVDCRVVEFEPPQPDSAGAPGPARMTWTWRQQGPGRIADGEMRIQWVLEPHEGGTRLTFVQTGLEALPLIFRTMMVFGWGTMLKRWLPAVLEAFERTPGGLVYHRIAKAPNRGHHKTKTVPPEFAR